jgi:hypothetical protein
MRLLELCENTRSVGLNASRASEEGAYSPSGPNGRIIIIILSSSSSYIADMTEPYIANLGEH